MRLLRLRMVSHFNPRSREGSDHKYPVRLQDSRHFNPRSREGSDKLPSLNHSTLVTFQSTLPRGERPCVRLFLSQDTNFNPRSREGSDHCPKRKSIVKKKFQSTLPRGERRAVAFLPSLLTAISIHAPARGATVPMSWQVRQTDYFNPRSREGSDYASAYNLDRMIPFQSTLPRGERRIRELNFVNIGLFQSTLPRGERLFSFLM